MEKMKSSNDMMTLDYDTSQAITVCFLKDLYTSLASDNEGIRKDIEVKDAFPAQLEDYAYNSQLMTTVKQLLNYFGEEV